jgi:hypothetical protein
MKRKLLSQLAKEVINEACWKGYEQIGMKDKGGRKVPNCVPIKEQNEQDELDEISLMTGDADKGYSLELFNKFARVQSNSKISKALKKLYGEKAVNTWDESERWYKDPTVANSLLDGRIQAAIKSQAIDSQGSLYITAFNDYSYTVHTLWKLDEPAKTAYVGEIKTSTSRGRYSMQRAYGIDSKVVHWSNLAQEYKGAGYGKFLYDTLLYYYGTLESDSTLYQGSQKMWMYHMPRVAKLFCYTVKHPGSWSDGGSQSRKQLIVLPADERDVADRGFVSNVIGSFVAFHNEIPPTVAKLARFAKGLNFREGTLNVAYINFGIDEKINELDPFDRNQDTWVKGKGIVNKGDTDREVKSTESFLDYMEDMSFPDLIYALDKMKEDDVYTYTTIKKAKKLILAFNDATVLVQPAGDKLKYELL